LSSSDTRPVRAGEELDLQSLSDYLRPRLGETLDPNAQLELTQFGGGHSNLTYLVQIGEQQIVLRRSPVGPVAPTAHDMPREFRLLQTIHPHFSLTPRPILLCEDPSVIGVPFYLMERRHGLIVRDRIPKEVGEDLSVRRRVSETVVDTLGALHAVDIFKTGVAQIGKPEGFLNRQVRGWSERWQRSKTSDVLEMDNLTMWLAENLPADRPSDATIVHNDFKLDNIMLDSEDPAKVVAVLDWEMSSVGDPLIDFGLLLCYWTLKSSDEPQTLRAVTTGTGWLTREEMIDRYQSSTGRDLSAIVYYETFAKFKVAVIIQQIFFGTRVVRQRMNDFGILIRW
jgi:aminoglycoside phosphotransferase (APT) family kinase protein